MKNISQYIQEFDEDFYTEGQFECDCHEKIKAFLRTALTEVAKGMVGEKQYLDFGDDQEDYKAIRRIDKFIAEQEEKFNKFIQ